MALTVKASFSYADGKVQKLIMSAEKARLKKYNATCKDVFQEAKGSLATRWLDAVATKKLCPFPTST